MKAEQVLETIERSRVVAILRGDFGARETEIVSTIIENGITAAEITLNSPDALTTIGRLSQRFGDVMAIGAGTVLKPEEVEAAAAAGARFVVSPNMNCEVIKKAVSLDLAMFPGCFTPTEILAAFDAGAPAVKLFPASCLGPDFIPAICNPIGQVRIVPTGGVTPDAARLYRDAGAWAVGVGSELLGKGEMSGERLKQIGVRAKQFVDAMSSC